jgi:hypothetical protein
MNIDYSEYVFFLVGEQMNEWMNEWMRIWLCMHICIWIEKKLKYQMLNHENANANEGHGQQI